MTAMMQEIDIIFLLLFVATLVCVVWFCNRTLKAPTTDVQVQVVLPFDADNIKSKMLPGQVDWSRENILLSQDPEDPPDDWDSLDDFLSKPFLDLDYLGKKEQVQEVIRVYKREQRGPGHILRIVEEVREGTPVNFPPCECECRHLMRKLLLVLEKDGFRSVSKDVLDPNRIPESSKHEVWEFWVGEPDDWYHRKIYVMVEIDDKGEAVDGESFLYALSCAFTEEEASCLFHELNKCNCCALHLSKRPETPQSWVCAPCSSPSEEIV
jgi:hypothetical protein